MKDKIKHLEMIENIIQKMGSNSFMLKGWTVTLVVGIFALAGKATYDLYFYTAYLPIVLFAFLDTYYLRLERIYKKIYDIVREKSDSDIDFNMRRDAYQWKSKKTQVFYCMTSPSIWLFYLLMAIMVTVFIFITNIQTCSPLING